MSEAKRADALTVQAAQRGDLLDRGLLIGGKSVPAGSGKLADDVSPWIKNSGYGKFGGTSGIESFTEPRWITIQHTGRPTYPF